MKFVKPNREVNKVFLHCSASARPAHGDVEVIRQWHKQRGWSDIGYHYFIPFEGDIQVGRNIEKTPSAQKGHNTGSIAICLHGLTKDNFTLNQFESLQKLCKDINDAYGGRITFHGHCEVSSKACPVFDYKVVLGLNSNGNMPGDIKQKDLDLFDTGIEVMNLQKQLNVFLKEHESYIDVDGIFGQDTAQAVIFFQMANGLTADGVVGPRTRLVLPPLNG